jgi:hypothetical protein
LPRGARFRASGNLRTEKQNRNAGKPHRT